MSDNEIIKALERQAKNMLDGYQTYLEHGGKRDEALEQDVDSWSAAINLINRQRAEIERLENIASNVAQRYLDKHAQYIAALSEGDEIRAEAIKEFAERLSNKIFPYGMPDNGNYGINAKAIKMAIDNLVKEMVGSDV